MYTPWRMLALICVNRCLEGALQVALHAFVQEKNRKAAFCPSVFFQTQFGSNPDGGGVAPFVMSANPVGGGAWLGRQVTVPKAIKLFRPDFHQAAFHRLTPAIAPARLPPSPANVHASFHIHARRKEPAEKETRARELLSHTHTQVAKSSGLMWGGVSQLTIFHFEYSIGRGSATE